MVQPAVACIIGPAAAWHMVAALTGLRPSFAPISFQPSPFFTVRISPRAWSLVNVDIFLFRKTISVHKFVLMERRTVHLERNMGIIMQILEYLYVVFRKSIYIEEIFLEKI